MNTHITVGLSLLCLTIPLTDVVAQGGKSGGKGKGETSGGIVTVLTAGSTGLFADAVSDTYEGPGGLDCVAIVTPRDDGVDGGRFTFIVPFQLNTGCAPPRLRRQLRIAGSGIDLNGDAPGTELIDAHFRCPDVFPNESLVGTGLTSTTSCILRIRRYDAFDEFETLYRVEWQDVEVSYPAADIRVIEAKSYADIYQPPEKGSGKRDDPIASLPLPFTVRIERVRN